MSSRVIYLASMPSVYKLPDMEPIELLRTSVFKTTNNRLVTISGSLGNSLDRDHLSAVIIDYLEEALAIKPECFSKYNGTRIIIVD